MGVSADLWALGRRRWRVPRSPQWRPLRSDGGGDSEPGGQPDRDARAGLDHRADQVIARALLGPPSNRQVAMGDLLVAKRQDRLPKRRIGLTEHCGLSLVMIVD